CAHILPVQRLLRIASYDKHGRIMGRLKSVRASGGHEYRGDASGKDRAYNRTGYDVFLRLEEGFNHALNRRTPRRAARDLRNHNPRERKLRMVLAVPDQRFGHLLRSRDAYVSNDAAMKRPRIVEIQNVLGKIGAVSRHRVE